MSVKTDIHIYNSQYAKSVKEKDSFFPKKLGVLLEGDNRCLVKPNTLNSKGISYVCEKMMCRDDIHCKRYAFMLTSLVSQTDSQFKIDIPLE